MSLSVESDTDVDADMDTQRIVCQLWPCSAFESLGSPRAERSYLTHLPTPSLPTQLSCSCPVADFRLVPSLEVLTCVICWQRDVRRIQMAYPARLSLKTSKDAVTDTRDTRRMAIGAGAGAAARCTAAGLPEMEWERELKRHTRLSWCPG